MKNNKALSSDGKYYFAITLLTIVFCLVSLFTTLMNWSIRHFFYGVTLYFGLMFLWYSFMEIRGKFEIYE